MKRDMNLLRSILLRVEETNELGDREDYSTDEWTFCEHVRLLDECGFIGGVVVSEALGSPAPPSLTLITQPRLTWEGHEFLDAARNPRIWAKALEKMAGATGTVSIAVLTAVLTALAKESLGLGGS